MAERIFNGYAAPAPRACLAGAAMSCGAGCKPPQPSAAKLIAAVGWQARVQVITAKRYAGTEPADARSGEPKSQFNISFLQPHSCAAAILLA